jgi:hypothetical protein
MGDFSSASNQNDSTDEYLSAQARFEKFANEYFNAKYARSYYKFTKSQLAAIRKQIKAVEQDEKIYVGNNGSIEFKLQSLSPRSRILGRAVKGVAASPNLDFIKILPFEDWFDQIFHTFKQLNSIKKTVLYMRENFFYSKTFSTVLLISTSTYKYKFF